MQVTSGGTTTTTTSLSHLEESTSVNGGSAAVTSYFYFGTQRLGEYQNSSGAWYDLLSDGLSSTAVVVTSTGVVAAQLFAPDGQARWAGGGFAAYGLMWPNGLSEKSKRSLISR